MPRQLAPLQFAHQASPSNPAAGVTSVFAKTGDVLFLRTSAGVERPLEPGLLFPFSRSGTLTVSTGTFRLYNDSGATLTIKAVRASVGTAPTGAAVVVDVKINGTTIFASAPARPTIAVSTNTAKVTTFATGTISDGSYFTIDITQVGSTAAGADLTVQILC
ncbi:hypothetical protein [Microbispora sp. NPDC049125]|uniref:hypothetical protein n=1 Tax=Microbispora sp. NPDC049125 TaxID=3154929 RepID=UPI0034678894